MEPRAFVLLVLATGVQGFSWEANLMTYLTTDYNVEPRPVLDHNHAVNVTLDVALAKIVSIDAMKQTFDTNLWIRMYWTDETLRWNSSEWGDTPVIRISSQKIWRPDILPYNSILPYGNNFEDSFATIYSDGSVSWLFPVTTRTTCSLDVTYFPYDEQTCSLQFGSWSFDGLKIDLFNRSSSGDTSSYKRNEEWDLVSFEVTRSVYVYDCCPEPYPSLTFRANLRRKTLFYNMNVIAPCILMLFVSLFGTWVPAGCGEKLSLGVNMLLALVFFIQAVNQGLPITSRSIPYASQFFGATILIVAISVSFSSFGIMFHFHEVNLKKPPPWLKTLLFLPGYRIWERRCGKKNRVVPSPDSSSCDHLDQSDGESTSRPVSSCSYPGNEKLDYETGEEKKPLPEHSGGSFLANIARNLQAIKTTADNNEEQESLRDQWRALALQLDKVLMVVIFVVYGTVTVIMFTTLPDGLVR
ncbi:PREDICTED: neuronal acetylcholine receptor subunit alpha-7-like [Branchiostoma belcheri]|uniref:Neuronal acetylcholine receptor subunit alpha-7-like n=1 Tax=Branchiostoma belcheri TaxID=7741 RepID=A0A6P5AKW5_BRABE|nr:PREDICTED: neuronal acetylcholine receptor subunit alpha-7-like [Branchiostoma belcheri]